MTENERFDVAIVGAGPSGLFAAEKLAHLGHRVAIFNRDVKPGGMAEYGIFPDKLALKNGLRKSFAQVLATDGINYFGNVTIGEEGEVSLQTLKNLGFPAILVATGAQGTKWLGLPGEKSHGVYHAKDLVYHYNSLPPYSTMKFEFGKRVAVIGAGKVMTDVVHYLVKYRDVDEVFIIVRRGPGEVKFEKKELEPIISWFDQADLEQEFARVEPMMAAIGQDATQEIRQFNDAHEHAYPKEGNASVKMRFLYSPKEIVADDHQCMTGILVEHNLLVLDKERVAARGTGNLETLPMDAVVFAIGDKVDEHLGLPFRNNEYPKSPTPRYPVEGESYEVVNPDDGKTIDGIFVGGWSRNASYGLVGIAKKDGIHAAAAVNCYLEEKKLPGVDQTKLEEFLAVLPGKVVRVQDLAVLEAEEKETAKKLGVPEYKFSTNEEMLKIMGL